jgi:hypothetical protein
MYERTNVSMIELYYLFFWFGKAMRMGGNGAIWMEW